MKRFTDPVITRLKPRDKKFAVTEGDGLYLQVSPRGKKTWYHYYTSGGKRKWYRLGDYPALTLSDARKENEKIAKITAHGEDPAEIESLNQDPTVRELYDEWFAKGVDRRGKPWSEGHKRNVRYMFDADVLPKIGGMKVKGIAKRHIRSLLESIEQRGSPNQALQVYRRLSRLFNYAASNDIIEVSPMASLEPVGAQGEKDRHLSVDEVKTFLQSIHAANMYPRTAAALELILRTAQRPSEVVGARQEEIEGHWWTIPATRTKNKREHRIYLTDRALSLFGGPNAYGFYFPSIKNEDKAMSHTVLSKALRRSLTGEEKKKDKGVTIPIEETFSPHDLRRTCATHLARLGYIDDIIGAVLNHKKQTVTAIYNRYAYDKEKQVALSTWNWFLDQLLKGWDDKTLREWFKGERIEDFPEIGAFSRVIQPGEKVTPIQNGRRQ